jgi:hypothetical protein
MAAAVLADTLAMAATEAADKTIPAMAQVVDMQDLYLTQDQVVAVAAVLVEPEDRWA